MKEQEGKPSEVTLQRYTEKDLHNVITFENGLSLLEEIGQAIVKLPMGQGIRIKHNETGRVAKLTPTMALAFEGATEGAARELCADGHQEVVNEILEKHQARYEDDPDVEIVLFET